MRTPLRAVVAILTVMATGLLAETADPVGATDAEPQSGGRRIAFDKADTVRIPSHWWRANVQLAPELLDPHEILAVATFPIGGPMSERDPVCVGNAPPAEPLRSMEANDVLIWLVEWEQLASTSVQRPSHFSRRVLNPRPCVRQAHPRLESRSLLFTTSGRTLDVYLVIGDEVSSARAKKAYAILDSLRFSER